MATTLKRTESSYPAWVTNGKDVRGAQRAYDAAGRIIEILRRKRLRADARRASRTALKAVKV